MSANLSRRAETPALTPIFQNAVREAARYLVASTIALALDAGLYVGLIRLGGVHYLIAAPIGYAAGIFAIYLFSTKWVFVARRLTSAGPEFLIFALIGVVGLFLNQLVIFIAVSRLSSSYELAKLASAVMVFGVNFGSRKLLLFTRF